jgi:hypothetical protein
MILHADFVELRMGKWVHGLPIVGSPLVCAPVNVHNE